MCHEMEYCAFYSANKNSSNSHIRRLVRDYCESPGNPPHCRRQVIHQHYDVFLSPAIGPIDDYLEYGGNA